MEDSEEVLTRHETLKLPPILTRAEKDTYFGDDARKSFFAYYKELSRQRVKFSTGKDDEIFGLSALIGEDTQSGKRNVDEGAKRKGEVDGSMAAAIKEIEERRGKVAEQKLKRAVIIDDAEDTINVCCLLVESA